MVRADTLRWPVLIFWAFWLALAIILLYGG